MAKYVCGICNKEYKDLKERMDCEAKCFKEREIAEQKLKAAKLEEEKSARKAEIEAKWKELGMLISKYTKDYGSIQLSDKYLFDDDYFPSVNKLLGWWY